MNQVVTFMKEKNLQNIKKKCETSSVTTVKDEIKYKCQLAKG